MGAVHGAECERAHLWVSLGLDAELSELEEASLRAHVGSCAACAGFERDLVALTTELRAAPFAPYRPSVVVALPRRRSTAVRVLQIGAAAAAVVLAAGLGSLVGSLSSRNVTTVTTARTGGGNFGAVIDRDVVAMLPGQKLPSSRIRPSVPV
jgi:predicted anti-sigma-YlaC factor YlaD